jgi:arylsulfatase A-like enzyme
VQQSEIHGRGAQRRPNIVLLMTDQQRSDQVGFASGAFYETPALDRLAARGVRFDCAYSASTTCVPARNALLTGTQPHRLPRSDHPMALAEGTWTVAHALRASGYETALFGKMHFTPMHAEHGFDIVRTSEHLSGSRHGLRPDGSPDVDDYHQWLVDIGLATWQRLDVGEAPEIRPGPPPAGEQPTFFPYDVRYHATTWIEQQVSAFLDQRRSDRPLFLVISFPHPHVPLNPPEPYRSLYDPHEIVVPSPGLEANDRLPDAFREAMTDTDRAYKPWRVDVRGEAALRNRQTMIRALIRQIDDAMGRVLARLDLGRTLVAFTSDHGDYGGHRGLASKMPWIPFDDLVRVPLVIAGPGIAGGRRVPDVVQSSDLALTFCEAAGIDVPVEEFDSRSLRPFLDGATENADHERAAIFATTMGWPGVRRGPLKLILHPPEFSTVLFDLDHDPDEVVNLSRDPARRRSEEELGELLRATFARSRPDLPTYASRASAADAPAR